MLDRGRTMQMYVDEHHGLVSGHGPETTGCRELLLPYCMHRVK